MKIYEDKMLKSKCKMLTQESAQELWADPGLSERICEAQ